MTEIGYTFDYHPRTNPLYMRLALRRAGLEPPSVAQACELGFGQGVSLAIHAAAGSARWVGNDINPDHVRHARGLVEAAGVAADLHAESFVDFAARTDLPSFDFIVLHGIWSWVSDGNRAAIVDFVGQRLRPGGVLHVSYNALPGKAAMEPLRHLVVQHARQADKGEGIVPRIDRAIDFAARLLATNPAYLQDTPGLARSFDTLKDADRRYLAHEYFNRDWRPMHFAEVAAHLAAAGLVFAGPAGYSGAVESLLIEPAQQAMLDGIDDPVLRETVRDFLLNRGFRYDYWIKAPVERDAGDGLRDERIVLVADKPALPFEVRAPLLLRGKGPPDATVSAVLDLLSDRRARSLAEIAASLGGQASLADIADVAELLLGQDLVGAAQSDREAEAARGATDRLNARLLDGFEPGAGRRALASPLLGGGLTVSRDEAGLLRGAQPGDPGMTRLRSLMIA
ncbi:MAG: class I SAM-dependent methyltransferase [Proteobacteria bacterium]|nr:class I SAM-dependent methyltransferase [Pseudomonadota bacterium]